MFELKHLEVKLRAKGCVPRDNRSNIHLGVTAVLNKEIENSSAELNIGKEGKNYPRMFGSSI